MARRAAFALFVLSVSLLSYGLQAQTSVSYERILNAAKEPHNWLTYGGDYFSHRYSPLTQITPANVKSLGLAWAYQSPLTGSWQATPLVVDGIMYLTQRPNDVVALDAATGRVFWMYRYTNAPDLVVCCGSNNRGLAILGETLFMGTLDAHLIALDARSGRPIWKTQVADAKAGYSVTVSPLVVKDKVVIGVGGGEYGIRGFISAYDARTGKEAWRFYTIPGPGEPGHETWEACPPNPATYCDPEAWKHGGGSVWVTGSYDPELNLTYWGTGNVGPDYSHEQRPGDNLYTAAVVALDADTGRLRWHYQFTPHDRYDYDAVQVPVLADITVKGAPVKAMLWANRNGNFYVLDRATGKFLIGKPFVRVNWMSGFDANGRPIQTPQPAGMPTYPAIQGGSNWYSPSYSRRTGLMYVAAWENQAQLFGATPIVYQEGRNFTGGVNQPFVPMPGESTKAIPGAPAIQGLVRGPINNWTNAAGNGAILAIDPATGDTKWKFEMVDVTDSGIVTTATDLLITGGREGYLQILDLRNNGAVLWKSNLGFQIRQNPMTYAVNGKQYIAVIAGLSMFVFALP
jgi:alcohol dehydrogenase (cytochrome c)